MSSPAGFQLPPNPGGTLAAQHVVGRDALVARLWQRLNHQSIALMSPRRVGKTSVLERMKHEVPDGWIVCARDLEGIQTGADFARYLYDDAGGIVGGAKGMLTRANELLARLTGSVEIKNVKLNLQVADWRRLIERLFEDLQSHLEQQGQHIVFFWDEFMLFIGDLASTDRARDAMVLLDTLRAARQTIRGCA